MSDTSELVHPSTKQDRAVNVIGVLTLVVTIGVLILAAVSIPILLDTSNNADQVRRGNEIAACRAEIRSHVDLAIGAVLASKAELDLLTNRGFEASMRGDDAELALIVGQAPAARDEVVLSIDALNAAVDRYAEATTASVDDPDAFLASCDR